MITSLVVVYLAVSGFVGYRSYKKGTVAVAAALAGLCWPVTVWKVLRKS